MVVNIAEKAETRTPAFAGSKLLSRGGSIGTKMADPGVTLG